MYCVNEPVTSSAESTELAASASESIDPSATLVTAVSLVELLR